jgi:replicative DNA helicase
MSSQQHQDTSKINELLPPHDLSAEEALLGAIILDDRGMDEISLKDSDFYHEPHMFIFRAFTNLNKSLTHIDQITVAEELNRMGKLEEAGGVAYLFHLITVCPSPMDAMVYADIIKRMSISRQLIQAGKEIQDVGYSNPVDVSKALRQCDEKLVTVRKSGLTSPIISPKDRAESLYQRYAELYKKEMSMAISTGITKLDEKLGGGFYDGDMIVFAGRTGMGKTTMLSFITKEIAICRNVLFCSAEMNMDSLSDREVAQSAGIPTTSIRLGKYTDDIYDKILDAIGKISERKVYLYDEIPMTTDKILQAALTMKLRHGLGAIVVDYMGILGDDYGRNSYERVSYISRKIKEMARTLNVPVIVAVQLSREIEKREDKRPELVNLRDSGNIEQDADVVLFLYREGYYNRKKENDDITEILIAKHRQGQANRCIEVYYDRNTQSYSNEKLEQQRPMI